jgi:hypothetical protein
VSCEFHVHVMIVCVMFVNLIIVERVNLSHRKLQSIHSLNFEFNCTVRKLILKYELLITVSLQ